MRRAIVHIGTPRSGTTSLQRYLFDNRERLLNCGILYPVLTPRSESSDHISHQYLGESLDGRRSTAERAELLENLQTLLREASADIVLLSYEGLSQGIARSRVPGLLASLFARHGYAMETLLTVRPQSEYLNSLYTHRVQFLREARPFRQFLRSAAGARTTDYDALLRPWDIACAGRVRAAPLRDARSDDPFVGRVLHELGLRDRIDGSTSGAQAAAAENRSPGPIAIEACRCLRLGGAQIQLGLAAREATQFLEQLVAGSSLDRFPFRAVDANLAARLAEQFLPSNDRLARRLWGESWASRVASEPYQEVNEIAGRPIASEVRQDIDRVVAETCARFGIARRGRLISAARQSVADLNQFLRRAASYLLHAV
jgi:hypothetical protein